MMSERLKIEKTRVDFGEVSDDSLVSAFRTKALCSVGQVVLMHDEDGNFCFGVVSRADTHVVWIEPSWETWMAATQIAATETNADLVHGTASRIRASLSDSLAVNSAPVVSVTPTVKFAFV